MDSKLKTDGLRASEDTLLEESTTYEVRNKIRIPCNEGMWEYDLTTILSVTPPSQAFEEPSLEIVGSFISREPITALEKIILDCKNANDI